jgi:hypothetical protein
MSDRIFKQAQGPIGVILETATPFIESWLAEQGVEATGGAVKGLIGKLKGVEGDVSKQSKEPSEKQSEFHREQVFTELANTFSSLGVGAPYNSADQLFSMFGSKMPSLFADSENYLQVLLVLKQFLQAASGLIDRDPNLATDSVRYMFDILVRSGFDIKYTINKLQDLAEKAADPFSDGYIISVLKGNFSLASVFLLMQSLTETGKFDSSVFKEMNSLTDQANKILGPASAELTNSIALQTALGKANFAKIVKDRNVYQASIPLAEEVQAMRETIMKKFGDFYNSDTFKLLLKQPLVKTLIMGTKGFGAVIEGVSSSSFGEAFSK